MENDEKRIALAKWILESDAKILNEVEAIYNLKNRKTSSEIVAFTVKGEPLTKENYIKKLEDATNSINQGNSTSHKDLFEEMQSW